MNSLKSSTIDSVPQNVEETWYDDQENNEEQFQIEETVACIWLEDVRYNITWYLGIVDQIVSDSLCVIHEKIRRTKSKLVISRCSWNPWHEKRSNHC